MAKITDNKLDEMYQIWLVYKPRYGYQKAFLEVARACRVCERTVRKYHKLGNWDDHLKAINEEVRKKTDTNVISERTKNLKILRAAKSVYTGQLKENTLKKKVGLKDIVDIVRLEMELTGDDPSEKARPLNDLQSRYRKAKGIGSS